MRHGLNLSSSADALSNATERLEQVWAQNTTGLKKETKMALENIRDEMKQRMAALLAESKNERKRLETNISVAGQQLEEEGQEHSDLMKQRFILTNETGTLKANILTLSGTPDRLREDKGKANSTMHRLQQEDNKLNKVIEQVKVARRDLALEKEATDPVKMRKQIVQLKVEAAQLDHQKEINQRMHKELKAVKKKAKKLASEKKDILEQISDGFKGTTKMKLMLKKSKKENTKLSKDSKQEKADKIAADSEIEAYKSQKEILKQKAAETDHEKVVNKNLHQELDAMQKLVNARERRADDGMLAIDTMRA